jgi:hypothetical protein
MSEFINIRANHMIVRRKMLATASALTLMAYITSTNVAEADDADRPTVWIELGGQLDGLNSPQQTFSPPFMASITQANLLSALNVQKQPAFAIDEDAKISFQPDGSDWVFSASIQYGRSTANTHRHQQTANKTVPCISIFRLLTAPNISAPYIIIPMGTSDLPTGGQAKAKPTLSSIFRQARM